MHTHNINSFQHGYINNLFNAGELHIPSVINGVVPEIETRGLHKDNRQINVNELRHPTKKSVWKVVRMVTSAPSVSKQGIPISNSFFGDVFGAVTDVASAAVGLGISAVSDVASLF